MNCLRQANHCSKMQESELSEFHLPAFILFCGCLTIVFHMSEVWCTGGGTRMCQEGGQAPN